MFKQIFSGQRCAAADHATRRSQATLTALPSKRLGLFAADGTLIARSDSNGEDLEAFAGAGAGSA